MGGNLNLTASFDHQRAAKIVCPLVVKNLLSDSDFPPKMVPIFSRYETTYCCLLVPWVFRYLCMWQGGPAAAWPHRTTGDWPEDSLPLSPPEKEVVHRLVDGYNFPPLLSNIGLTLPPLLIMFLVSTNKSISLVWILKLRKCNSGEYQIFHIYR